MSDAPDKMWVAPFPTLADAVAGDWPSPANKEERLYLRKDLHDAATRQARNDALREPEEKVVNRLNEELPARACRMAATNSDRTPGHVWSSNFKNALRVSRVVIHPPPHALAPSRRALPARRHPHRPSTCRAWPSQASG